MQVKELIRRLATIEDQEAQIDLEIFGKNSDNQTINLECDYIALDVNKGNLVIVFKNLKQMPFI